MSQITMSSTYESNYYEYNESNTMGSTYESNYMSSTYESNYYG